MSLNNLNSIYFLFLTIWTIVNGQNEDNLVIKKIINGSGIYYEPLSNLKTYTGTFNLLIHVNITTYLEKFQNIDELLNNNTKLCKTETHSISSICSNFLPTLHTTRVELNKRYKSLMSLQTGNRVKRGLFNAIGNFEEWAFGSLGDDSYQELQKTIQRNSDNSGRTVSLMKTQSKIVQSTINQITNISSTLSHNFVELQTQYNHIISKINRKNLLDQISSAINSHFFSIKTINTSFKYFEKKLLNHVIFTI